MLFCQRNGHTFRLIVGNDNGIQRFSKCDFLCVHNTHRVNISSNDNQQHEPWRMAKLKQTKISPF